MIKRYCSLLLFFLVGCREVSEQETVLNILRDDVSKTCVYTTLSKHANIYFNTINRVFDINLNKMVNSPVVDIISIDYDDDLRYAKQMELLVEQELFIRTNHYINKGNFNLSGYYSRPVQFTTNKGTVIETTIDRPGGQYQPTKKGREYIKNDTKTGELSLCIGYLIPYQLKVVKEDDNRFVIFYQLKLGESPEWLTPEMLKAFPSIDTEMKRLNTQHTVYRQYVSKNTKGQLSLP